MPSRPLPGPRRRVLATVALGLALAGTTAGVADAQGLRVVAGGLANPRGLTVGPGGQLYVAEAGSGGSGRCLPSPEGGAPQCYGATGAITRVNVRTGRKRTVAGGLPSLAAQGQNAGGDATGPHDVSFSGPVGYFTVGLGGPPASRSRLGAPGRRFAGLYRLDTSGRVRRVADLGAYEAANNPDAGQPSATVDTNPFSVDATRAGQILVTDAGGNDLLAVTPAGKLSRLTVFPFGQTLAPPFLNQPPGTQIPYQPVPTGVARGARGAIYVGQLTGFPFPAGAANVYRVRPGSTRRVQGRNFTTIVDVASAPDGSLYVLQISTGGLAAQDPGPGRVFHIALDGAVAEIAPDTLQEPTGIAVAPNGAVYVSNRGGSAGGGQIVRLPAGG